MTAPALILGSSGQVARSLKEEFKKNNIAYFATSSRPGSEHFLDLGDANSITKYLQDFSASHKKVDVYLPGAMTHVDRCETERTRCHQINVEGPHLVGKICADLGYRLCFYSSEYVFGNAEYLNGAVGPFRESDPPAPTSYYGECKLEAERLLSEVSGLDPLLIRTTMVFSWDLEGLNFFMQLYRHLEKLKHGEVAPIFRIPIDQVSSPTYAPALATASRVLMDKGESGILHIVGKDLLSRKEFLEKLAATFGFANAENGFQFLPTRDLGQVAKRPLHAGLVTEKAEQLGIKIWTLTEAFADIQAQKSPK